jgi:CheY-like chemotaxis protein
VIPPYSAPSGLRILVAEDDASTATATAELLGLEGHEVHLAGDGASALEAVEAFNPDVVLLDIGLPVVDGYEVAKRVKGRNTLKTPLLIALTGYGADADRAESAASGIDLHWVKPVDPDLLLTLLKRFQRVIA